jgi:2-polyprenyl-6-hydroxyphenyl methylase/3-demethylubiquinone-9 3-methyltransferase
MLRAIIAANVRLSLVLHRRLPWRFRRDFFRLYYELVAESIRRQRPGAVLDVGCGRRSHFVDFVQDSPALMLGLDSDFSEILHNRDLEHLLVADATKTLPFADSCIDFLTSRSVLEHLRDTEGFLEEACRILTPGGYAIHVMPGRNAPFAVINRLVSNRMAKRLLRFFYPEVEPELGFPAYYDNCSYRRIGQALERTGFDVVAIHCRYYQATY